MIARNWFRRGGGWFTPIVIGCVLLGSSGNARAQDDSEGGIWLTPRMIKLIVERIVNDKAAIYGFDEKQRAIYREKLAKGLPAFLEKNQATIQPIMNDVLVHRIGGQVPSAQKVAGWAQKVQPVFKELAAGHKDLYQTMRPHMRPKQRAKWARDHFVEGLGFTLAERKLQSFAEGKFDVREWQARRQERRRPGAKRGPARIMEEAKKAGLDTEPPADLGDNVVADVGTQSAEQPASTVIGPRRTQTPPRSSAAESYVPLDKWQSHAKQFIKRYGLDEGQKTSAMAILKETRARAQGHSKRHAREIQRLRKGLRKAKGAGKARLSERLAELEAPLREIFEEYQERLNQILTESQRQLIEPRP